MSTQVPIENGQLTWTSEDLRLIGSDCQACGAVYFPARSGCSRTISDNARVRDLGASGSPTSTIGSFAPKAPHDAPGEPVGASGTRRVDEHTCQPCGRVGKRRVPKEPHVACTHVPGAPGLSGVTTPSR